MKDKIKIWDQKAFSWSFVWAVLYMTFCYLLLDLGWRILNLPIEIYLLLFGSIFILLPLLSFFLLKRKI